MAAQVSNEKTAFVAMKFDDNYLRDKRYGVIRDCLEEAGYAVIRADEIRTSGPSAEEVCALLRDSTLVVVDTSGDSHNVSYELGYCHGVGRTPASTLLLRDVNSSVTPFNYRHFRYRSYKNLLDLRQVIRDWFGISAPMASTELGYMLNFAVTGTGDYGVDAAAAIIKALKQVGFSGRCEYYAGDGLMMGMLDTYLVGLGLKPLRRSMRLDHDWWDTFASEVATALGEGKGNLQFRLDLSELGEMLGIRTNLMPRGAVEFVGGSPRMILREDSWDTWFVGQIKRQLDKED